MSSIDIASNDHWHSVRRKHIGGSEIAALFNMSPYGLTKWQLYHMKRGTLPDVDLSGNSQVNRGKHYEPAIAAYAQEKFDIRLRKVKRYLTCDEVPGYGASLDYEMFGDGELVPTEIKLSNFSGEWEWDGDVVTTIPDGFLLQLQHQIGCTSATRGQIIADVGYDVRRALVDRSDRIIGAIKDAVRLFWDDVANNKEPPVDFTVDADAVNRLAYVKKLRSVTLNPDLEPVFSAYNEAKSVRLEAEKLEDAKKTQLLKAIIDAGEGNDTCVATCMDWKMKVVKIADNPGREITTDMVGDCVGAKKGHNRIYLSKAEPGA